MLMRIDSLSIRRNMKPHNSIQVDSLMNNKLTAIILLASLAAVSFSAGNKLGYSRGEKKGEATVLLNWHSPCPQPNSQFDPKDGWKQLGGGLLTGPLPEHPAGRWNTESPSINYSTYIPLVDKATLPEK